MIVQPQDVLSLGDRLTGPLVVLFDKTHWSVATAYWDREPALLRRWNGSEDFPKGNLVSTGQPTWFVVLEETWYSTLAISDSDKRLAASWFLNLDPLP